MFYYRPGILLQSSPGDIIETVLSVFFGLLAFAACWDGFLLKGVHPIERIALLLAAAGLFVPGLLWNAAGLVLFAGVFGLQKMGLSRAPDPVKPGLKGDSNV